MAAATQISLAEYLNTDYSPDVDFVDGATVDRNVGKRKHSRMQSRLARYLDAAGLDPSKEVLVEQRVRVAETRVRVPDICVADRNEDEILTAPPDLCVEILSPDDRWSRIQTQIQEYLAFGVPMVWIIDPYTNEAWAATSLQIQPIMDGVLRCPSLGLELSLTEIFG